MRTLKTGMRLVASAAVCLVVGCGDDTGRTSETGGFTSTPMTTSGVSSTGEPMTTDATSTTESPTTGMSASGTTTGSTGGDTTAGVTMGTTDQTTGPACDAPMKLCGDACIDPNTDEANCGDCGVPCAMGQECVDAVCQLVCPMGQLACGDACVDPMTDGLNCGGCDMPCDPGYLCMAGTCALDCMMGFEACGMSCVDTKTDEMHCGGCDKPCGNCQLCTDGACGAPPAPVAPGPIQGMTMACANASVGYSVPPVMGATKYTWTLPMGASITQGMDTNMVTVKLGATSGQVCVTYNDGCVDSLKTCVDVTVTGGAPGSQTLAYTGAAQDFTVPMCVSKVTVELWGAQGGGAKCCDNSIQDDGGKGGYVKADLTVNPGDKLSAYVGGKGVTEGVGGWNGGGPGQQYGAGGGGASDVRVGGQALANRVLVAGGGGGGNCGCPDHGAGGAGGGLTGGAGISNQGWVAGGGGTQNAGGTAGSGPGVAGQLGVGGGPASYHVAGGGGGYYGGGGAYAAGGGGGSSYYGNAMNASTQTGLQAGNGQIKISW